MWSPDTIGEKIDKKVLYQILTANPSIQGSRGDPGNGIQGERRHLVCGLHYGRDDQVDLIDEEEDEQEDDDDVGDDNVEDLAQGLFNSQDVQGWGALPGNRPHRPMEQDYRTAWNSQPGLHAKTSSDREELCRKQAEVQTVAL